MGTFGEHTWGDSASAINVDGLVHHSDKGVQYLAVRYTQRLAEAGAVASVGSTGDSYDNALAEAFNSLFKAELVRNRGPWKGIDDLEIAVAEYIDWFNHRRLHGELGLSHRPSTRTPSTGTTPRRLPSPRQFRASTEPGARQPWPSRRADRRPPRCRTGGTHDACGGCRRRMWKSTST
ncbi:hypothetical protein D0Z06_07160 [Geodermatophilus marinus]|nr:hypothetical protein D0Z06_07160 [Geodermatophilus sp. LHW52908]